MSSRLSLQTLLENILGSNAVYYQPPSSIMMSYPAIVYSRKKIENTFADDSIFMQAFAYDVTVIDDDPDSEIVMSLSRLPRCSHDRHYTSDGLNHDVFVLYY